MMNEPLAGYELWELSPSPRPAVTQLFALPPCGLGTPASESLSSYVVRLAQAHRVRVQSLVAQVLRPALGTERGRPIYRQLASFWGRDAATINGTSGLTEMWVTTLGLLTGRGDLSGLTMRGWAEVLASRELLRLTRVWCPRCYAEAAGGVVYDRLQWALACVTVCQEHHQVLEHHCPVCGRTQRILAPHSRPGCCSWCGAWLGQAAAPGEREEQPTLEPRQLWVVQAVGELIAQAPSQEPRPGREQIQQVVKAMVGRMPWRRACRLARLLKTTSTAVYTWASGRSLPQLDSLLRLSASVQISPYRLLTDADVVSTLCRSRLGEVDAPPVTRRRTYRHDDPAVIQETLQQVLESPAVPPASVRAVAQHLRTSVTQLRLHDPERCRAISARYRAYWAQQKHERLVRLTEAIRAAVMDLHLEGSYPSRLKVAERLGKPGVMRAPEVRAAWRQALCDLRGHNEGEVDRVTGPAPTTT